MHILLHYEFFEQKKPVLVSKMLFIYTSVYIKHVKRRECLKTNQLIKQATNNDFTTFGTSPILSKKSCCMQVCTHSFLHDCCKLRKFKIYIFFSSVVITKVTVQNL